MGLVRRWRSGETLVGTMVITVRNPAIAYALASAGFDFIVLDCEHGAFSYETVEDMALACRGAGIALIVRIPGVSREPALKCLEAGADGIIAPQIETVDQVEALVDYARYAPVGNRGVSLNRPHTGFRKVNTVEYMRNANQDIALILQIESRQGVENIGRLTGNPHIDAILIGPNDLAQSLTAGKNNDPVAVDGAIGRIIAATHDQGLVCGIHCAALDQVLRWKGQGLRMLMWSSEIALMNAMATEGLAQIRGL